MFSKRPKNQSEIFFIAKFNDETKTCLAVAAQLLRNSEKVLTSFLAKENYDVKIMHFLLINICLN